MRSNPKSVDMHVSVYTKIVGFLMERLLTALPKVVSIDANLCWCAE